MYLSIYDDEDNLEVDSEIEESKFYGLICDAIMRGHCENIDDNDGLLHTSDVARLYAKRFMEQVGLW